MDGSRFDDLTRTLANGVTRRGALRLLLGGAAAAFFGGARADAAPRPVPSPAARKPPGFERLGKRCDNGQSCGVHVPCDGTYCAPVKCWIEGQVVDHLDVNDDKPCLRCVALEHNDAWARWSRVRNGQPCAPGDEVEVCESNFAGACQEGECVPAPRPDGTECGPEQICCTGDCCAAGLPCNAETGCGGCQIDGANHPAGPNRANPCLTCDAVANPNAWIPSPGNPPCGDDLDRVCCNGDCCPPDQCCSPAGLCEECCEPGQRLREDGSCEPEPGCEIAGESHEAGDPNPAHDCEVCNPESNPDGWTPVDDQTPCGGVPGRVCCNGECCSPTECCTPTGACEECGPHCRIGGEDIDEGTPNPDNPCEVCNPEADPSGWSPADNGSVCGGDLDGDLVCCAGTCCGQDLCCVEGACGACRCEIGDRTYEAGETEPGNDCHVCNPEEDRFGWTPRTGDSLCGSPDGRNCCAGVCCPSGECCNAIGECEPCGCVISGDDVFAGSANPANTCEVCNPDEDRFAWTILDDDDPCGGDGGDRVCCGGACCPQGECCEDGACRPCGCEIAGATYQPETPNPQNSCQVCDPSRARLDWSPVIPDGDACGTEAGQTCCGGDCCATDECCLLGACGTCLCVIDGDNVAADTPNPENPCEVCRPKSDPFAWTVLDNGAACGDGAAQVCCSGSCCPDGECCSQAGACEACGCAIEGESYVADAPNPANACQVCKPDDDPTGWSPVRDDSPCGDLGDRVCCLGECCEAGECCTAEGLCASCGCQIAGEQHAEFALNPANGCEWCDPDLDPLGWSPISDSPCAEAGDRVCCTGLCCEAGQCCGLDGQCVPCDGCTIDGLVYPAGTVNPAQDCQVCDPNANPTAWTARANDEICGPNGDRACCDGVCCTGSGCCVPGSGGQCSVEYCGFIDPCAGMDPCGCTIGGAFYENGALNPDNECESCDVTVSTTAWTPKAFGGCGGERYRYCAGGVCCDLGICPDYATNTCGDYCSDVCVIGGVLYFGLDRNPANPCQHCAPSASHTSWSYVPPNWYCDPVARTGACCFETCCGPDSGCNDDGVCIAFS